MRGRSALTESRGRRQPVVLLAAARRRCIARAQSEKTRSAFTGRAILRSRRRGIESWPTTTYGRQSTELSAGSAVSYELVVRAIGTEAGSPPIAARGAVALPLHLIAACVMARRSP